MKVSLPTPSYTTSTPLPWVSFLTRSARFSYPTSTCLQPCRLAIGRLVGAADDADHARTEGVGPLAEDQADATGRGRQQHHVAALDLEGLAHQNPGGQALEQYRRGLLVGNVPRQLDRIAGLPARAARRTRQAHSRL